MVQLNRGNHITMENGGDNEHERCEVREGRIVKLRMTNFITYDSVVCTPGDSLNIVIGPNGTGKSTILSAIVLGLGGKPSLLGKSTSSIQEFIKAQKREAHIEIELLRQGRNTTVKRSIYSDGKSIWHIDGVQVPGKNVEKLMKELNIQIDNLCQVLPQDRVQDFAKLNKQELLEATQKAVGKEGMFDIHAKLKDLQRKTKNLEVLIANEKKRRELEQASVDRLRGSVEKIYKRQNFEKEAENCKLKLLIIQYQCKRDEVMRYKDMLKKAADNVKLLEEKLKPYEAKMKQAQSNYNSAKNKYSGIDRKIFMQLSEVKAARDKLESLRVDILELEVNLDKKFKTAENQKKEEDKVSQAISKLRNDIVSQEAIPLAEQEAKIKEIQSEVQMLASCLQNVETAKLTIEKDISEMKTEMNHIMREINRMENMKEVRMRSLLDLGRRDVYEAAKWVDANRHRFQETVYLPMIVELDVNPKYARYVENAIGHLDLVAILCESRDDMKLVIDECRVKMGLSVNVLQVDSQCRQAHPKINFSVLKQQCPEFDGYLKDFVKGPDVLLNFLYNRKDFHNIPVSLRELRTQVPSDLGLYYMGDIRRSFTTSRYSGNRINHTDLINEARFFKTPPSQNNLESLKSRAEKIQNDIASRMQDLSAKEKEIKDIDRRRNEKREEQRKIQKIQTTLTQLRFQLSHKERTLSDMKRNQMDPAKVKGKFEVETKAAVLKLVAAQEVFFKALKLLDSYVVESNVLELEVQAAKAFVNNIQRLCRTENDALERAKLEKEQITNTVGELRTDAQRQVRSIESKFGAKLQDLVKDNEELFSTLPNSVEELESHIEDKMAHAQMLSGGNDNELIRQYEGHLKTFDNLNSSIETKERQATDLVKTMEDSQNKWKEELDELVSAICKNFSRYFKEMKCAGTVELYTGSNEHDYDNYGLSIRVKFRNNEELRDLNAYTQSGGERAVSTAIYMLSLQELTPVPFRLVDEINQGMDSNNERRVYDLLLQSTSRPGTPQYFLLTPKLLKDMNYSPRTTILCVMNSACAPDHKTWDIKKFIAQRKQQSANGGNRSGNQNMIVSLDSDNEDD